MGSTKTASCVSQFHILHHSCVFLCALTLTFEISLFPSLFLSFPLPGEEDACGCCLRHGLLSPVSRAGDKRGWQEGWQEGLESEQWLFVGPQGCAIPIRLSDTQHTLFDVKDSFPHITVAVAPGKEAKHHQKGWNCWSTCLPPELRRACFHS